MGPRRGTEKREKRPVCQLRFEAAVIAAAAGAAVVTASLSFPFFIWNTYSVERGRTVAANLEAYPRAKCMNQSLEEMVGIQL